MILVTGATGFVGSVLVRQLLETNATVRVLRRASSALDLLGPSTDRVEHVIGDVTDSESVRAAMRGVHEVYHVAASVAFGRREAGRLQRVNVEGTANVVNAALEAGVRRLAHTSSIAALGRPQRPGAIIDEDAPWSDATADSRYGMSKRLAELEVFRGIAEGLDAVIVNPSLIFGPGRAGENTMQLVERLRAGRMPFAPPGGTGVVDVEDVAVGLRAAMERGRTGDRYILSSENLLWTDILSTLANALAVSAPKRVLPNMLIHAAGFWGEAWSLLPGASSALTRETARKSTRTERYDGAKARRELGLAFRPFTETASRIGAAVSV